MGENIIITGGKGNLGKCLKSINNKLIALDKRELDITSLSSIKNAVKKFKPKYIINCAVLDVNYCENNQRECFAVNFQGVLNLKKIADKYKIKLIQVSSDAAINPVNTYGKSKKMAENYLNKKDLIIRTSFYSKSYHLLRDLLNNKKVKAYNNIYFNPVSILALSEIILKSMDKTGVINVFSNRKISKYDFALLLCRIFNFPKESIVKSESFLTHTKKDSFIKSDFYIDVENDLKKYKEFLNNYEGG